MALKWYPIDPTLILKGNNEGAFAALSHLPDASIYKPNARPNNIRLGSGNLGEMSHSISTLGQLGVLGYVSAQVAANTRVITKDFMRYTESTEPGPWSHGTLWGVGFRLILSVSNFSSKINIDALKTAALAVEVGVANVSLEIKVYGFSDRKVLEQAPIPGRFDLKALKDIQNFDKSLVNYVKEHQAKLGETAVPFQVWIDKLPGRAPNLLRAQSYLFAMQQIEKRVILERAEREAREKNLSESVVNEVYSRHVTTGYPADPHVEDARSWIEKTNLVVKEER